MAKKSAVERNNRVKKLASKYANRRASLKAQVMDKTKSPEERFEAVLKMAQLPKNSAKERIRNRCELTGRPRGVYRKFKMARNMLRDLSLQGQVPGVVKSSW